MKKLITVFIVFISFSQISVAQMNDMAVGMNGTLSIPIGDFNDIAKIGYGVSGSFYYELTDRFEATGTLGYISWGGDKVEVGNTSLDATEATSTIPILIGGRYYFDEKELTPYASGELGMHIFSSSATKTFVNGVESADASTKGDTNVYFGFGLGGGATYELSNDIKFDGSLQYNIISANESKGFFSLEIGFIVGIN